MAGVSLLVALLAPLVLAVLVLAPATRAAALRLAPWAPLPALGLALVAHDPFSIEWPGVLLGTTLGLDATGRVFLLFTALVWLLAGVFARGWLRSDAQAARFWACFLAAETGNLGVCLALDAGSFYLLFALMTFAAYGLVVHNGSAEALRAGRVYLTMAVLGEAALVAGLLLAAVAAGSHRFDALATASLSAPAAALLIAGFGIKVGVPLLHMWLPLAHPVAPVPASAVLSGVMLKAGLLGWLRCLPLGTHALPEAGLVLMLGGLAAMLLGVAAGLMQRNPKVLLAYSSISQMGYLALGVGAALAAPATWPLLAPALGLYALHHALAKSSLFLGVGLVRVHGATPARLAALALPALALAGAPLTSGVLAKAGLKQALDTLDAPWPALAGALLPLAAVGTALLMARLVWLVWDAYRDVAPANAPTGVHAPWLLGVLASATLAWAVAPPKLVQGTVELAAWPDATWPLLLATVFAWLALRARWRAPALPPGDLLLPLTRGLERLRGWVRAPSPHLAGFSRMRVPPALQRMLPSKTTGALWLACLALLAGLLGY